MADESLMDDLMRVERCAEDVLTDRQQIVDLDRRRNKTREAMRALRKNQSDKKAWLCFGDMFLKLPKDQAQKLLQKDYDNLDEEINDLRKNLKPKVQALRNQEHKEELKGFGLTPLTREELKSLDDVL